MTRDTILTHIDPLGRATLTLNRPEVHNAFDDAMIAAMTKALKRLDADDNIRVVLLSARGKNFSAGADLGWMRRSADYSFEQNRDDALALAELMKTLDRLSKPTIAQVHGAVYGGGVGLVACCDVVLATPKASFCLSEVKLGLIPAVISPYVVAAIGQRAARRYFLTAELFSAEEALRLGLVHEIVEQDALQLRGDQLSRHLLGNAPQAMAEAKQLVKEVANSVIDDAFIAFTAGRIAEIRASKEGREGLGAFLEKRKPSWSKE